MMEQAHQYWMLMKRRQILKSHFQSSMNESSWEERAFAEDSARHLGGCIWPPRSYSCSFCKREFRSAQALGGHMNVHRRDRARLKQSLCTHHNEVCQDQNDSPGPFKQFESRSHHFQADHCSLGGYDLDLNSLSSNVASSSFSSSRVSALTTQENLSYVHTCASPNYPASVIQEKQKVSPFVKNSRSDSLAARFLGIPSDSKPQAYPNEEVYTSLSQDAFVGTDLFMGLNSAINQYPSTGSTTVGDATSCKRPKTAVSALSFLIKPCSNKEVIGACSHSSMEDIDLELRLGEPPKVK